jgi:Asp-tRNA(Asn)/Glu-tRNA(Gln) amidotransferase A subunit family amidase
MFNWLQLPAISLPIGLYNGMPIGLQLVGKPDSEPRMLAAAAAFMAKFPQSARPRVS